MKTEYSMDLLRENFNKVEKKFEEFFSNGVPRWPGEQRDFLRNHHRNLDNLSVKTISFDRLAFTGLPEEILKELETAFDAFKKGLAYR